MYKFLIVIFSLFLISSCNQDIFKLESDEDHIIFGSFYGFCSGEQCIENFKLTNSNIYEDLKDHYRQFDDFNFQLLNKSKYEKTKDVESAIPTKLFEEKNGKIFGCPDCADQGGLVLIISTGSVMKTWIIDQNKNNVPVYLHDLMDIINTKIDLLK